jgi:hypothetical protein
MHYINFVIIQVSQVHQHFLFVSLFPYRLYPANVLKFLSSSCYILFIFLPLRVPQEHSTTDVTNILCIFNICSWFVYLKQKYKTPNIKWRVEGLGNIGGLYTTSIPTTTTTSIIGNWESSVGIATRLWAGRPTDWGRIPVRGKRSFSSLQRPDRLRSISLQFVGYRCSFPGG